jgi:hypothetical protein
MIGNMFNTASRRQKGASKRHGLLAWLSDSLDAYAMHRVQMAVPESEQRRAERAISRYRRQMRRGAAR